MPSGKRRQLLQLYRRSLKARPGPELANVLVFRPLGFLVARALLPTRVRPIHLVLTHTALGLLAAGAILRRRDREAAALLQLVTVLDNADGQLARLRGEETELGRYADTELDALKNLALFAAVAARSGRWSEACAAYAVLTALLSWDFNVEYLYRSVRGEQFRPAVRDPESVWVAVARALYDLVFAPQDRAIRWVERQIFRMRAAGALDEQVLARKWWARWLTVLAANLGLSTQYLWLGSFLWRRCPERYLRFVFCQGLLPLASLPLRWWLSRPRGL